MKHTQAFPRDKLYSKGMDLRDYFAAKAMQSLIPERVDLGGIRDLTVRAYLIADNMLTTREEEL